MVRSRLVKAWREAAQDHGTGRSAGAAALCANWDEVIEIIATANVYTIKTFGPDRVVGFSPYLSLIGGTLLSFYDWYCDLPPSSPQTWGEQTDLPKSADWYNSGYIISQRDTPCTVTMSGVAMLALGGKKCHRFVRRHLISAYDVVGRSEHIGGFCCTA
jgi:nitrate reductase alpha subunit